MSLAIQLPEREEQLAFNLEVWGRMLDDPALARIEGRLETNRHGQILMTPPPGPDHGGRQAAIAYDLRRLLGDKVVTECPISTSDGVRAADVGWFSPARHAAVKQRVCFVEAPEICVEMLSPSNTRGEIEEKRALFFDAGATEVWTCGLDGAMRFDGPQGELDHSQICPDFPREVAA